MNYDIVFQEIPGEVTLAINLSNCPYRCEGCHSPYLREDKGEALSEDVLSGLLDKYGSAITCVCFMGGDASLKELEQAAVFLKEKTKGQIKTGWYSGRDIFPNECSLQYFDYIKLGAYREQLGGLDSHTTNQRLYHIENEKMMDITSLFLKRSTSI